MFGFLKKPHQFFAMRFKTELERIGFVYSFDHKTPLLEIKWSDSVYQKFTTVNSYVEWVKSSPLGKRGRLMWELISTLDSFEWRDQNKIALIKLRAFNPETDGLEGRKLLMVAMNNSLPDAFKLKYPKLMQDIRVLYDEYNSLPIAKPFTPRYSAVELNPNMSTGKPRRDPIDFSWLHKTKPVDVTQIVKTSSVDHSIQNMESKEQQMSLTHQFLNQKEISICIHELCKLDYKFTYNGNGSKAVTATIEPPRDLRHPTAPTVTVVLESDLIAFFDHHPEAGRVLVLEELHHLLDSLDISVNAVRHALEVKASDTVMRKYNSLLPVIETARSTSNEAVLRIASKLEAMALNYSDHPNFVFEEFVEVPIPTTLNEPQQPKYSNVEIDPNMSTDKPRRDPIDKKLFDLSFFGSFG
jgi:hypothetical protein